MKLRSLLLVFLAGCSSQKPSSEAADKTASPVAAEETKKESPADTKVPGDAPTCADAPGWKYEPIELPPGFAPTLPKGQEKLYFAPGMFDSKAKGYWSYVFSLEFDAPFAGPDSNTEAVASELQLMLTAYYDGLISAVAEGKDFEIGKPAATVAVQVADNRYEAEVKTYDSFGDGNAINVRLSLIVSDDKKCINVAASSKEASAPIWQELDRARGCLACP